MLGGLYDQKNRDWNAWPTLRCGRGGADSEGVQDIERIHPRLCADAGTNELRHMDDADLKFLKDLLMREYGPEAAIEIGQDCLSIKIVRLVKAAPG